jgi:hypothetical protein
MTKKLDLKTIETVQKLELTINVERIRSELACLVSQYPELETMSQFAVTSKDGSNDWSGSIGLWKDGRNNWTGSIGQWKDVTGAKSPKEFHLVAEALRGTYIEKLITKIFPNSYRWRVWKQKPGTCLAPHSDRDWRIHIPIYTSPLCFLALLDNSIHAGAYDEQTQITFYNLQESSAYILNAHAKAHGVFNFSLDTERWHLVGSIY